jgi:formylglycine-generating enzyme required for sulfatase activity
VVRGGNWATSPSACRTVNRARNFTSARIIGCGFRVGVSLAR